MPDFGDNVRIKETPETQALDIAGRLGNIFGFTTPSVTNVDVVGSKAEDLAYSVNIEELNKQYWLAPDQIEFIDHGAGTEMRLDGVAMTWRREADGSWTELPDDPAISKVPTAPKPWWRFW
ncbi:MAG: hypothetical protein IPN44_05290 [Flavobacteriales bacterium]|nr:hypothetical protein [Flavobacteriales bacterium]